MKTAKEDEIIICEAKSQENTFYIFRKNGVEVEVQIQYNSNNRRKINSSHELFENEEIFLFKYII